MSRRRHPAPPEHLVRALKRCNQEIDRIENANYDDAPAYLVTLGLEDWKREKREIEQELARYGD